MSTPSAPPGPGPGDILSHYQIIDKIGEGGMGAVYRAVDQTLGRTVAIKTILADRGSEAAQQRFIREARYVSALNHPNIVTIYEAQMAGDIPFIAMEYVPGVTLAQRLRKKPLTVTESLEIAEQICSALVHAHQAGIVHRDLKPGNTMLTKEGTAKVLDFGLAKKTDPAAAGGEAATAIALTATGVAVGTLAYMSPEQAVGDEVDGRSDLFSFGVILYEMLALQRPFNAPTTLGALRALVHSEPTPIHEVAPWVPPALEKVVTRCLAKDPNQRYQSAKEVATALARVREQAARAGEAPTAPNPVLEVIRPGSRRWWKHRVIRLVAAGAAAITLAVAGYVIISKRQSAAIGVHATPVATYASEYDAYRAARAYLDRYDKKGNIDRAVEALDAAIRLNANYGLAYAGISEAYLRRNIVTPDQQWVKAAQDSARKALGLNPDLAVAQTAMGNVLAETGDREGATAAFRKALDLDPSHSPAYLGLAKVAAAAKNPTLAETQYKTSIELAPKDWIPSTEYGIFLYRGAKYAEAAAQWEKATALAPDNARILRNLGAVYHELDRSDDAASALQRALEIEPTAQIYANLGTLRYFQGRYVDAATAFRSAVDRGGAGLYLYWGNLGDALRWVPGQKSQSVEAYTNAIELVREKLKSAPDDSDLRGTLAVYLAKAGDPKAALAEIAALEKLERKSASSLFKAGLANEVAGNRKRALSFLDASLKAGYSVREVRDEPELAGLRADAGFRELLYRYGGTGQNTR